jgi:CRP-like cAMP-binding protein
LLRGLDDSDLRSVIKAAEEKFFAAGSVMLRQGYPANKLLLLVEGRACYTYSTEEGKRLVLRWTAEGKLLGVVTLLSMPRTYYVSTEAAEDCRVLVWERATIHRLAVDYPVIWQNAFEMLTLGIGPFIESYASQVYDSASVRLARVLLHVAEALGRRSAQGIEVSIRNEELAQAANVTTFTASRLLNQWQRKKLIVKTRRKIVLRCPECLLLHEF